MRACRFGSASLDAAGEGDALLVEGDARVDFWPLPTAVRRSPAHAAGCACCVPRSPAALALDRLFQARAKGEVPFFRRVLAVTSTPEGDMAVWAALRTDPLVSGRFRLDDRLAGDVLVAAAERALHIDSVDPAPEFQPRRAQQPGALEAERGMHADRADILGIADHGDHLPEPDRGRFLEQAATSALPTPWPRTSSRT